ncbi:C39 family peptidase [Streptomyces atratus]|uniref:C39 family peptidase n=1 Tax=Streptomyces atratus TaxID=1893 RepID=UPI002256053E|nr:C39 family peptidase [Streptomyces atratus]MCX5343805.1 C39 family peptidase [Streptomyces atratus]
MNTTFTEGRSSTSRRRARLTAAAVAALATAGILIPAGSAAAQSPTPDRAIRTSKTLSTYKFQQQKTFYYCGPAATRLALTQQGKIVSQKTLAKNLKVEENGQQTDNIDLVTKVLNKRLKGSPYKSKWIPGDDATSAEVKRLKKDIKDNINKGYVVVANVYGTAYDTAGKKHAYNQGHYLTVVGYTKSGDRAVIEDIAKSKGHKYTMTTKKLATWIASKGYSA